MATNNSLAYFALGGVIGFAGGGALAAESASFTLSEADRQSVFKAAGAVQRKGVWVVCADDPHTSGARIEGVRDLNGDGLPDVVVMEDGSFCHGDAGTGYQVLSKQRGGGWKMMASSSGMSEFLNHTTAAETIEHCCPKTACLRACARHFKGYRDGSHH